MKWCASINDVYIESMIDANRAGTTVLPDHSAPSVPGTRARARLPPAVGFVATSVSLVAIYLAAGAPTPLLPGYQRDWHLAPAMVTLAFGAYAISLLLTLAVAGSLSDHLGRRPLLIGALAVELVAMLIFLFAPSIGWLIAGRIVQGIATGAASSSFGAAAVELAPEHRKKLGGLMASLASLAGLGIGALFAGIIAQFWPAAAAFEVWLVLVVVMVIGTILAVFTPETAARKPGALASLTHRVPLPRRVRRQFAVTIPGVVAVFTAGALFLGLVPIVLTTVFGLTNPILSGAVAFVSFGIGAIASVATAAVHPHRLTVLGNVGMAIGALLFVGSVALEAFPLVWASAVLAGAGLGATFSGTIRGLIPEAAPDERAGVFAAVFIVAYLALGVSAIAAGLVANIIGVASMAVDYGIVLAAVSVLALILSIGWAGRAPQPDIAAATVST